MLKKNFKTWPVAVRQRDDSMGEFILLMIRKESFTQRLR